MKEHLLCHFKKEIMFKRGYYCEYQNFKKIILTGFRKIIRYGTEKLCDDFSQL